MSPVNGFRSPEEYEDIYLSEGATLTLDGEIVSAPKNKIKDAAMQDLAPDGTKTMRLLKGPKLDGHHFYSTPPDGKQSELVKQTGLTQGPNARTRLEEQPIISIGQRPRTPFDPKLPQLIVKKVPLAASKQGFTGGWRLAAVGGKTKGGAYTTTTEPVAFQHGNGQRLEWYPPADASDGIDEWVFFLSEEALTEAALKASTMREQDTAKTGTRKKICPGPYERKSKKRPSPNETFLGRSPSPTWGGRRDDLRYGGAPKDLNAMENASFFFVFSTPRGDSGPSARSRIRSFKADKDHAVFARPNKPPADATGFKPYVQIGGVSYRVVRPNKVREARAFGLDVWVPIYGNIASDVTSGASDGYTTVLVQEDPPEEDASGVEPPTGETDPPVGTGFTRPGKGTYRKTYAPVYGGVERRAAVPVKETITDTEMLLLEVPNPVNRLANPAGTARGADGLPLSWTANLTNGVLADALGKLGVATSGLVNDTTGASTGNATPYRQSDFLPVNQGVTETVRGILEVSSYAGSGGFGRHSLVQLRADGTTVVTTLTQRNSNGSTPYDVTVGPTGSGASLILDEGATDTALRIGTDGSVGRNMTVRGYDLALHPFDGAPRKFVFPPEGVPEIADPDAPPEADYPPGPVVCITRPKSATPPPGFVPVEALSAPTNPTTAGWTANRTNNANVGLEVANPYRAYSNATNTRAQSFWSKTYPIGSGTGFVNGSSLAVRGPFSFPLLPARAGNTLIFLSIHDAAGNFMGFVRIHNNGSVLLIGRNRTNRDTVKTALTGLSPSDIADAELIAGGGNTTRGRVSLVASVGGEFRRELASVEGIDFAGRVPRQIRYMGVYESDTAGRWEVLNNYLRVTSSGDVVEEFSADPLPPDRPVGANGSFLELDEDGEPIRQLYIFVPPNFEGERYGAEHEEFFVKPGLAQTLSVYARFEDLAPQQYPTMRLRLFDTAGNEWEPSDQLTPADLSGTKAWGVDLVSHFTPPPGFFRGRLEVIRTGTGAWISQLSTLSDGEL